MKRIVLILTLAASLANGAQSPLTAGYYIWAKPGNTNLVQGLLHGDQPGPGLLRYEDMLFLKESLAEREALSRGSYSYNDFAAVLSSTNRVWVDTIRETSPGDFSCLTRFLDPGVQPSASPRVVFMPGADYRTNATVVSDRWQWRTNAVPFAPAVVTQAMTNRTVNVQTNRFAGTAVVTNAIELVTVTNANVTLALRDFCTAGTARDMTESLAWKMLRADPRRGATFKGPYSHATVSNNYALARAMRRLMPMALGSESTRTNGLHWVRNNGSSHFSFETLTYYSANAIWSFNGTDRQTYNGSWQSDSGYPKNVTTSFGESHIPDTLPLRLVTSLDSSLDTFSTRGRILTGDAFALVTLTQTHSLLATHTEASGVVVDASTNYTESAQVMMPIGQAVREPDRPTLCLTVTTGNIYEQACQHVGFAYYSRSTEPVPPRPGQASWHYTSQTTREKTTYFGADVTTSGSIQAFVILHLNPNTKLNTWSEYD